MKFLFPFFLLSLSCFSQSPFLVEEEFDNAPTAPSGWTFSGIASYSSGTMTGKSINSVKFDNTGDMVTSKNWGGGGDQMTFVMRGSGTPSTTDVMLVEIYNGSTWSTLASAHPKSTARVFVFTISSSITQARFTYTKNSINVEFDDFTIRQSGKCTGTGPYLTSINVDACGSGCEGRDEFFTFLTGSTALNLSDVEVSYPDANNSSVTWCGSSANAPCDNYITTNASEVTSLNSLAGCTIFLTPSGSIPAYAPVMVFNGNGQNTRSNFGSLCGTGVQYYALFANNTSDCNGRFGNYSSTAGCTPECYRGMFIRDRGTGCADTNFYSKDAIGNADGAVAYYSSPGVAANYQLSSCNNFIVLPLNFLNFYAVNQQSTIDLYWETALETDLSSFIIERSLDGYNFSEIGRVTPTNTSLRHSYVFSDASPELTKKGCYFRIAGLDNDGSRQYTQIIFAPKVMKEDFFAIIQNEELITIWSDDDPQAVKTIEMFSCEGSLQFKDSYTGNSYSFRKTNFSPGIFFFQLSTENSEYKRKKALIK